MGCFDQMAEQQSLFNFFYREHIKTASRYLFKKANKLEVTVNF